VKIGSSRGQARAMGAYKKQTRRQKADSTAAVHDKCTRVKMSSILVGHWVLTQQSGLKSQSWASHLTSTQTPSICVYAWERVSQLDASRPIAARTSLVRRGNRALCPPGPESGILLSYRFLDPEKVSCNLTDSGREVS
jgi:hypothetical protein